MAYSQRIETAIFDMDGLLIDSEPLWLQAELDIFGALGWICLTAINCLTLSGCASIWW